MKSHLRLEFGRSLVLAFCWPGDTGNGKIWALVDRTENSVCINVQHLPLDEPQCNTDVKTEGSDACCVSSTRRMPRLFHKLLEK